jgi:hypothetical protein
MMGTYFFVGLFLTAAAAALGTPSGPTWSAPPDPGAARPLTLVGCVQPDAARPEWFTLSDKRGTTYHLTGANVKAHVWRNVRILGGLVPSPNLTAQAGAIDQTKAAMVYQGASPPGTGNSGPLEFSVTRVQRVTGSCAPKSDR